MFSQDNWLLVIIITILFLRLLSFHEVLVSAEEQILKLQTIVSNQKNDKEVILDLKNRILEYEQSNQNAVKDFRKFKSFTQGDF